MPPSASRPQPPSFQSPASREQMRQRVGRDMTNHPPRDDDSIARFEAIRQRSRELAYVWIDACPPGPELDEALRLLTLAQMQAVAAVARPPLEPAPEAVEVHPVPEGSIVVVPDIGIPDVGENMVEALREALGHERFVVLTVPGSGQGVEVLGGEEEAERLRAVLDQLGVERSR